MTIDDKQLEKASLLPDRWYIILNKLDDEMTDAYRADDPLTGNIIETDLRKKFKDAKDKYGEVDHISKRTSEITGNPPRKHLDRSEVVKKKRN